MSNKNITLTEIKNAVEQAIVASKKSDSDFWGEQIETNKRIEKKLDDHLDEHKKQQTEYNDFYKRVEPILKQHEDLQATKRTLTPVAKGFLWAGSSLGTLGIWELVKVWIKNLTLNH